jgi:L-2-hydroxyglutarate oxidase
MGVGRGLRVLPFRGEYYDLPDDRRDLVRSHVYPAPDPAFPFLGVHLSRRTDGRVSIGPGAILSAGREVYEGFLGSRRDMLDTFGFPGFWRMVASARFRRQAAREWKKSLSRRAVWEEARRLVPDLREQDLGNRWCGIRAQVVSSSGRLIDDLHVEETSGSIHVLNAVSPALTCALPFAEETVGRILRKL